MSAPPAQIPAPVRRNTLKTFGSAIRAERYKRNLWLRQVAERGYISTGYLAEIERGEKSPTVPVLEAIAKGLGMTLGELLLLIAQEVD